MPRALGIVAALASVLFLLPDASAEAQTSGPKGEDGVPSHRAGLNTALSLVLPGAGQLRQGHDRGWIYLAAEAAAWAIWIDRRHRGGQVRDAYRQLAWDAGRLRTGPRMDGSFPYYEALSHWGSSGSFDADEAPGLQPETDPTTFNGAIWALARDLFLAGRPPDPDSIAYRRALDYYDQRAYGDAFLWDWSTDPAAQERFGDLIEESDDRFREATVVVGAVLANHIVSAIDAYLASPLSRHASSIQIRPAAFAPRRAWAVSLHIGALP